jgi:hypothetical protein
MRLAAGRRAAAPLALACLVGISCHAMIATPLAERRACAGALCATPREALVGDVYVVDLEAPRDGLLRQAVRRRPADSGAPCATGQPVVEVTVDGAALEHGPARIGGWHRLRLRFPRPEADLTASRADEATLELELASGGRVACLAVPVAPRGRP